MRRRDLLAGVTLYILALAARLPLLRVTTYGDEPLHYWVARNFTTPPSNVMHVEGVVWPQHGFLLYQRPLFFLLFHVPALFGFTAFRTAIMVVAALLPVAAYALVRVYGGSPWFGLAAGSFTSVFPLFVTWGALALMDSTMAVLVAAGLVAWRLGRVGLAAASLLAAVWIKETAFIVLALLACFALADGWIRGRVGLEPPRLDRRTFLMGTAAAIALVPLDVACLKGLQLGATASDYAGKLADVLFVTPWAVPVAVLGLTWKSSRPMCALALSVAAVHLGLHVILHRAVEAWYLVLPAFLAVCAIALALQAVWRAAAARPATMRVATGILVSVSVALAGVLIAVPPTAAKAWATHPISRQAGDSLAGTYHFERSVRDQWRVQAETAVGSDQARDLVAVDLDYPQVLELAGRAHRVYVDSGAFRSVFPLWFDTFASRVESRGTVLLVMNQGNEFDGAIDEVYGPCRTLENPQFRVYVASACAGQRDALEAAFRARHAMPP